MQKSKRIHSYDFFQGVLATGLIFLMTFLETSYPGIEIFYRWASLGFVFFSGLVIGEIIIQKKSNLFFIKRGVQIFAIFLILNILTFLPTLSLEYSKILEVPNIWEQFSSSVIKGDYSLTAHLLLPLSGLFFCIPIVKYIPNFLGFFWSTIGFFLLDVFFLEKDIIFLNAFLMLAGISGFFTGKLFSLENIRLYFHKKLSFLPYIFLYIALAILIIGGLQQEVTLSKFQIFWSFHFLIMILLYFSLPSLLFSGESHKPALRKFFETIGVKMLFIYIFTALLLKIIHQVFPQEEAIYSFILAMHLVILSFAITMLLQKTVLRSKKWKKRFQFLF